MRRRSLPDWAIVIAIASVLASGGIASACGGFFCQQVPIDQAGEQIIFRQDGNQVTAVVLIQYEGAAEEFSWVVPVPGVPDLSVGSDLVFSSLEPATRPVFSLAVEGEQCDRFEFFDAVPGASGGNGNSSSEDAADDDGVEILQRESVGPFDTVVVTSDDPQAMAQWLTDNDYDLTDRGDELIAPYVELDMNFVAVRLRQDQEVGDIQPLIMRYETDMPMIPIRLTAVAAMPDMGIVTWLLGPGRAVPVNYLHVTPNYTRLNWYVGTNNAYGSYQDLITDAMNEAGGQGFATDYAGRGFDVGAVVPDPGAFRNELQLLAGIEDDASSIASAVTGFVFPQDQVVAILIRLLPLPAGSSEFTYQSPEELRTEFTEEELEAARDALAGELETTVIDPLEETLAVFDGDQYMTRLYTTLSPEEMTVDPCFSFNTDLGDQGLARNALMEVDCVNGETQWSLTLGSGTGRDGERVIEGRGTPPGFTAPVPDIMQESVFRTEMAEDSGPFMVVDQKEFDTYQVVGDDAGGGGGGGLFGQGGLCGTGIGECGPGMGAAMLLCVMGLRLVRTRRR